jgi:hypothetical protein
MMTLVFTGTVNAQTVTAGPYLADAAWDQTLPCTTAANCPRFSVLSNMNKPPGLVRARRKRSGHSVTNVQMQWR